MVPGLGTGSRQVVEVLTLATGSSQAPAPTLRAWHLVEVPGLGTGSRRAVVVLTLATGTPGGQVHQLQRFEASHLVEVVTVPGIASDRVGVPHPPKTCARKKSRKRSVSSV
ncbi:MAG: hypothetical protein Q7U49_12540 [Rhodoferax sp.]|nr:hypothetical protein [Rhodoferax sp.]MDO9145121.1 hypothetical protein [Rhodoferax sp.]MDP3192606.1 hypothetical protein [Rhodoferax sp.]MDP3864532.1 hypothetical protein [Rhodoferax sp.]